MNEQPHPDRVRLLPWRIPDRLIDTALVIVLIAGFLIRQSVDDVGYDATEWIALGVAIALIPARRLYPVPALVIAIAAAAVAVAVIDRPSVLVPVALVALFNVAQHHDRRTAILAGAATTVCFLLMFTILLGQVPLGGAGLASIAWPAFAATAGAAVRSTRENVNAAEERALRAEESREREAERRVVEERLRIARDVHDLVAHHLAVVNVQSAVAGHLIESDPPAAAEALTAVRGAASSVLDQLGELLSVLRSPDEFDEPTAPTPNLAAIDDLISSFTTIGLEVRTETSGAPRPLSGLAELTAYRVVQEALTNAHKHGDGTATVALRYDDAGLGVSVTNPFNGTVVADAGSGFGLIGMRERVEAVGGTFEAATSDDGHQFAITATIPAKGHE